jgi:hypothetical protein
MLCITLLIVASLEVNNGIWTMFCNGFEGQTGSFTHHDIVQDLQNQHSKKYLEDKNTQSHMPKEEPIRSHIAECLQQAEGAGLQEGSWLGGDAWFGLLNCVVE